MKNKLTGKQKDILTYVSIIGPIALLMGFFLMQLIHDQQLEQSFKNCKVVELGTHGSNRGRTFQPTVTTEGCNGEDKRLTFFYGEKQGELANLDGIIEVGRVYNFETQGKDVFIEKSRIKEVVEVK